ncbi:CocE/NonD family hydrolase [Geminocystis sp. NIES-3709]|uniref:CocE/NonD family hydrolase n=1 Tax=Geminocystis sp. NIES-3709 TaxID=1617448 RepID=UPI0005FC7850|nr:CocE/NonD family hydrolase [Geminocystis sp. NIES-3709]BAQ66252.1 peptidase S15 [Geminocystis sp. NIES-3709]
MIQKETVFMTTRDGISLASDIYYPVTDEKLPVLLMRQPYGKSIASTVVYAHPKWYAKHGYIVVIQDVRGRGESEGEFQLFETEINDGYDTLEWVANINRSNGKVGMYGFSYQGMTQLYCAISQNPALKTICPAMIAYDLYSDWAYENGAFCYQLNLAWAIQLSAETARLKQDLLAYKVLYLASRNLPVYDLPIIVEEALKKYCPSNFYFEWLKHKQDDEYWQKLSPKTYFKNVDLPMLHIGGWFDTYLRGSLNLYQEINKKSKFQQHLIIGPWAHLPWGNTLGDRYYTTQANNNINEIQIAWFNKHLKGIENSNLFSKNIQLFQMGTNKWIKVNKLNNENKLIFYLNSTGLANIKDDDGKLIIDNQKNNYQQEDIIIHDFWRSTPSLGGHSSISSGSFDRSELDNRSDVITYTSNIFSEDLEILGDIELEIYVQADTKSFDLSVTLSQKFNDGKVYNFNQGYIKINNHNSEKPIKFLLQSTCIQIQKNTALRLSISPSNFPSYSVNFGRNKSEMNYQDLETKPITIIIFSGQKTSSKLIINQG